MAQLFSPEYALVWAALLAVALFFPVRQLIWVMSVRRAERDGNQDETRRRSLKHRASVTAALLCFIVAYFYVQTWYRGP
jgi:O-antigen/teichoic acid export membrane protein